MTGRLSGGAIDPNALGILCGAGAVAAAAWRLAAGVRRAAAVALRRGRGGARALGLAQRALARRRSGFSRSLCAPRLPRRAASARCGLVAAALLVVGGLLLRGRPRGASPRGSRSSSTRPCLSTDPASRPGRCSGQSAVRLFGRHPIAGAGLGAFSWQLPNLLAEEGRSLPVRDNPGNAYLQALAETGTDRIPPDRSCFAVAARSRGPGRAVALWSDGARWIAGCGAASSDFSWRSLIGSHWLAPDVVAPLLPLRGGASARTAAGAGARRVVGRSARLPCAVYAAAAAGRRARDAFAGRGVPLPSRDRLSRQGDGTGAALRLDPAALRDPGACRARRMRLGLAHFTPEGKPVELIAEADGREVLSRAISSGRGARAAPRRRAAASRGSSGSRCRAPSCPGAWALGGPPGARPVAVFPGDRSSGPPHGVPVPSGLAARRGAQPRSRRAAGEKAARSSLAGAAALVAVSLWVTVPAVAAAPLRSERSDALAARPPRPRGGSRGASDAPRRLADAGPRRRETSSPDRVSLRRGARHWPTAPQPGGGRARAAGPDASVAGCRATSPASSAARALSREQRGRRPGASPRDALAAAARGRARRARGALRPARLPLDRGRGVLHRPGPRGAGRLGRRRAGRRHGRVHRTGRRRR